MNTQAEIEAAFERLPMRQKQALLKTLAAQIELVRPSRGFQAAASAPIEGLAEDLSTNTKTRLKALIAGRHGADC